MEIQSRNGVERENRSAMPGQEVTGNRDSAKQGVQGNLGSQGSRTPTSRRTGDLITDTSSGPFGSMLQLSRDMDRLWDSFFGRGFGSPSRLLGAWPFDGAPGREGGAPTLWTPRIDVRQRDDAVLVHADLPGCRKEDVRIEATDEGIAISGERSQQREEGEAGKGYHLSERSYGSFYRNIPLPEGAKVEQARARMAEGVLEISVPLEQPKRRQIAID